MRFETRFAGNSFLTSGGIFMFSLHLTQTFWMESLHDPPPLTDFTFSIRVLGFILLLRHENRFPNQSVLFSSQNICNLLTKLNSVRH